MTDRFQRGSWHGEVFRLRADGYTQKEIADRFNVSQPAVRGVLSGKYLSVAERESRRAWHRRAVELRERGMTFRAIAQEVGKTAPAVLMAVRDATAPVIRAGGGFVQPHVKREIKPVLKRDAIKDATLAFARGEISRAELTERIAA